MGFETAINNVLSVINNEMVKSVILPLLSSMMGTGVIVKIFVARLKFRYSKDIESLKNKLENHTYTSKVKFDIEINIYRDLSEKLCAVESSCMKLFPSSTNRNCCGDDFQKRHRSENKKLYTDAITKLKNLKIFLDSSASFIPENIFSKFIAFYDICEFQTDTLEGYLDGIIGEYHRYDSCYGNTRHISGCAMKLRNLLREHIDKMEISLFDK